MERIFVFFTILLRVTWHCARHHHHWDWTVDDDGHVITAYCLDCDQQFYRRPGLK